MAPPVLRCQPGHLICPPPAPPPRVLVHDGHPEFIDKVSALLSRRGGAQSLQEHTAWGWGGCRSAPSILPFSGARPQFSPCLHHFPHEDLPPGLNMVPKRTWNWGSSQQYHFCFIILSHSGEMNGTQKLLLQF